MKSKIKQLIIGLFLFLFLFFLSSCHEKGCTDPSAINYNSVADEDDGSCITCKGQTDSLGVIFDDLWDNNSSSPHYNQLVATFYAYQLKDKFTYTECGTNACYFKVVIVSHVNSRMTINYNLQASGNIFFSRSNSIVIQPNQTMQVETIPTATVSNPCGFISSTSLFISLNSIITYN